MLTGWLSEATRAAGFNLAALPAFIGVQGGGVEHFGHFTAVESENGPSWGGGVEQGRGFLSRKPRNRFPTFFSTFLLFYFLGFELRKVLPPSTLEKYISLAGD